MEPVGVGRKGGPWPEVLGNIPHGPPGATGPEASTPDRLVGGGCLCQFGRVDRAGTCAG